MTIGPDSSSPWSLTNDPSVRSQPDGSEGFPDQARVLAASPDKVGLDDGVSSIKE